MHTIQLMPMGNLAYTGRSKSLARDLYVALCGPLMHVLQACPRACGQWYAAPVDACLRLGDLVHGAVRLTSWKGRLLA